MTRTGKPCIKCGSTERTNQGACYPCKRARDDKRIAKIDPDFHKKKAAKRRKDFPEKTRAAVDRWNERNPEKRKQIRINYGQKNPEKQKGWNGLHKRKCKQQTIKLSEKQKQEIMDIYAKCPEGHQVDHIIPLNGRLVCGLHVPWNLQYLTTDQNQKKKNKHDSDKYCSSIGVIQ